VKRIWTEAVVA